MGTTRWSQRRKIFRTLSTEIEQLSRTEAVAILTKAARMRLLF